AFANQQAQAPAAATGGGAPGADGQQKITIRVVDKARGASGLQQRARVGGGGEEGEEEDDEEGWAEMRRRRERQRGVKVGEVVLGEGENVGSAVGGADTVFAGLER
ncbi:hypothetical protein LTR66_014302, partial [Elasticomyces elasticus]